MVKTLARPLLRWTMVVVCCLSIGCASIFSGSTKMVTITSTPSSVPVEVSDSNGIQVAHGTTPFQVSLKRGRGYFRSAKYKFKATMPGKPAKVVGHDTGIQGWYWGNLLLGGVIGMLIVDPITGAMWDPPSVVNIDLVD